MARSDLILSLVKAGASADRELLRRATEALIAEERAKRHDLFADRLDQVLRSNGLDRAAANPSPRSSIANAVVGDLLIERTPELSLDELILEPRVTRMIQGLVEEQHRRDLLRSHNLEPRHRVLLIGPPGNGKTSVAEALAYVLMVPFLVVRYDGVIGSYLGETATRLRRVFEFVRTRSCILFFDEFDTLGKERGDVHDTGEIKRVVSTLLLQIDDLPPHVVVVTATNHPELLDRAVWRRFQILIELRKPTRAQVAEFLAWSESRLKTAFGYSPRTLADKLVGLSYAELSDFVTDVVRRCVLDEPNVRMRDVVRKQMEYWQGRAKRG